LPSSLTYSPLPPQFPADQIRVDSRDPRSPMNPLAGIYPSHRNYPGYRHSSPDGDSPPFRITATHPAVPQPIMNYESCIMHCYTFSAKEKDSETGLSYFGSRYYSSDLSVWLSVDPMASKYPSLSPYVYCANNPVRVVDPDGEDFDDPPTIKKVNDNNKSHLSKTSYGETSGIYPTKNVDNPSQTDIYNPTNWDSDKKQELLKARAAIHLIGTTRNKNVRNATCPTNTTLAKTLAAYHLTDNFPSVDDVIANDNDVKFFYLSSQKKVETPSIDSRYYDQKCVKTYGPFYNVGGGDVPKGKVYIHFYKAIPKPKQSTTSN